MPLTRCSILSYATILRRRQYTQQCYNSDICRSHCNSDYHNYNWTDVNCHDTKVYLVIMLGHALWSTSTHFRSNGFNPCSSSLHNRLQIHNRSNATCYIIFTLVHLLIHTQLQYQWEPHTGEYRQSIRENIRWMYSLYQGHTNCHLQWNCVSL